MQDDTTIVWTTEKWPVAKLKEWDKNPRDLTEKGLKDLEASITRLGYIEPIAINTDGTIIGGHARKKLLKKLGIKEVDVRVPERTLTEKELEEANIRLNKNIAGTFNFDILANEFDTQDLIEWGFEAEEFGIVQAVEGLTDPDSVPETPERPVTVAGDLWILGNHRVLCGDSTSADAVGKLLGDVKPLLMVTDPPYGVEYDPAWRQMGWTGARATGKVENDDKADWREAYALFPGDVAYVWHASLHAETFARSLRESGFELRAQIIWAKQHFQISRGHYHWQHEPCWYAVKKNAKGHWSGDRKQTTVWQIANAGAFGGKAQAEDKTTGHGTQKPVECMKRPIQNNSSPGQAVYDPFLGSGTTIIAAEMTGRACFGLELNPAYVDVIVKRWQDFTGKEAVHAETGETFAATAARVYVSPEGEANPGRVASKKRAG